ncbi:MAG: cadmium-translocating P-type ATPase [Bacteroidetes bacterium]|nr:MAG: cadmium-translocating P-type ATPase [Bacteroidota bacterium]
MTQPDRTTLELPIEGMDCASCARSVQQALCAVPGVREAQVLLSAEKAILQLDPAHPPPREALRAAVASTGHTVPDTGDDDAPALNTSFARRVLGLFGLLFGVVLIVVVAGEWLGLFDAITERVPLPVGIAIVVLVGYPVFREVIRAAWHRRIIAHTLMAVGALAALLAGEWVTATLVVFFMRMGDYAERSTTERARDSLRSLSRLAPRTARVLRGDREHAVPIEAVQPGEIVLVRPGESIPVDGEVIAGRATIDQATITGESMPVEAGPGSTVYAATIARLGALRIRTTAAGPASTFGRVLRMVEEAEAHRGDVQRLADRFSTYYLPVVAGIALLTYLLRQDLMATVAVLVVACSCAFALATPVAILASVGAGARRGLLIKGGKYLETLDRADVLLLDKTGTLTLGHPRLTDEISLNGRTEDELLALAASAERHSEHPLAEAVRQAARERALPTVEPEAFEALPGEGVRAVVQGHTVRIGSRRTARDGFASMASALEAAGRTLLFVEIDGEPAGILGATDTERPEVPEALAALRAHGLSRIELLTGDHPQAAAPLAERLGIPYRAGLLPEDKIAIVRQYQAAGHTVVMIGDGVNDAPALAQADVGIAMGAAGTDVAIEAAHVALMRDDWRLVPELFALARRTMRVVRLNIGFTAVYNLVGLTLAALGFLPPVLAAAAQSLPDLGIMANSARLIRR